MRLILATLVALSSFLGADEAELSFLLDSDGDGLKNIIDNDDDNDGVPDNDDGQPLNAASSVPQTESVTVVTSADAPLRGNTATTSAKNYGSDATAQTRNSQRGMLMKFGLPADGVVQSVELKLSTSTENDPLDVYLVPDNSWTEDGATFNNAPLANKVLLAQSSRPSGGAYSITLPQNVALSAGQTASLYVEDPDDPSGDIEELYTKETAGNEPFLLIEKSATSPLEIDIVNQEAFRDGGAFTVGISLRSAPAGTVYAPFAVSAPSVASITVGSVLTFTADNWATPQTVQIAAADVGDFALLARPLHSDDPAFNGINPEDVTGFKVTAIDLAAGTAVEATTGEILSQTLQPSSAVGSTYFRWQLISGPQGLNVVENTGRLTFRPTSDQAGLDTTTTLQATDEFGNTARFEIPVTVASGVNTDPVGVYVVPGTGSDSTGDGSAVSPYGTIDHAIEQANTTGKSTVFIRGGEYSLGSSRESIATSADSEIVVRPLSGEHVKLNFSGFYGFDITSDAKNITFEGLEIDGGSDSADFWDIVSVGFWTPDQVSRGGGIAFNVNGQFITIRDNYIHDAYQKAVEIKDGRYVTVDGNIIRHIATTSLSGGHGIMRQQKGVEFFDDDLSGQLRWDITGNMIFNVEQRIYSWVPSKGFIEMVLDEGKPVLIDDPKDTDGSQEEMAARISNNIVAFGAIDGIRLKSTPNLEVSHNSVFSQAALADGITDKDGDTATPTFTNFKFTNNAVDVNSDRFAVEIDDAVDDAGSNAIVSGNVVGGGRIKPSGQSGVADVGNVQLFTDAINGDFSINPALGLSEVGVAPAILSELDTRAQAFGVEIGWDRWEVDHLKLTQTILDNIPGVNDGVVGNEIAFTDQGTFNAARTTIEFSTVNGAWKSDRGATSSMDFHLNDEYSAWYQSIDANYKQSNGSDYSRIRWGGSVLAQDQVLAADGLLVSKVDGAGSSTQIEAAGRTVTLGGDLLVDLTAYDPTNGSFFDLIVAGQVAANFDKVLIKQLAATYTAQVTLVDTDTDTVPDTVRLTVSGNDSNNAPTGSVTISGSAIQGETLTATHDLADADGLGTVTYTWKAGGDELGTGTEYVLTQSEVGRSITVTASYIDQAGYAENVVSDPTGPVENVNDPPTGTVSITGLAMVGRTLVATNELADADGLGTLGYQWKADGTEIGGATSSSYILTTEELGKVITVTVSYTDGEDTQETVTSGATDPVVENTSTLVLTAADLDRPTTLYQAGETIATLEGAGVTVMIGGDDYEIVGNEVRLKRDVTVSLASPLPMLAVTDGQDTRFLISKHFGVTADLEVGQLNGTSRVRDLTKILLRSNDATGATHFGGYFKVDLSSLQLSPDDVLANADFNAFVDGSGSNATAGPVQLFGLANTDWDEQSDEGYSWPYTSSTPSVGDTLAAGLTADYGTASATLTTGDLLRFNLDAAATSGVQAFLMLSGESNTDRRYIFASESDSSPYVSVSYVSESPIVAADAAVSIGEGGNTIASPLALISAEALPTGAADAGIESVGGTSWASLPLSTHATFTHEAGYREVAGTHGMLYVARDGTAFYQHDGSDLSADATDTFAYRFAATIDGVRVVSSEGEISVTTTAGNQAPIIATALSHVVKQGTDYAVVNPETGEATSFSSGDSLVVARLALSDPDSDLVQPQWTNGSSPMDGDGAAIYELDAGNLQVLLTAAGKVWVTAGNELPALSLAAVDDSDTATNYTLVKVHPVVAHGRSVYVSLTGAGSQDGSSPANAVALDTALQRETARLSQYLMPGDTVFLVGTFENPSFQQSFSFDGATAAEVAGANIWHNEKTVNIYKLNGEYGQPITFTGYNDSTLLKGDGAAVIEVKASRFIRVMNLEVQGQVGDPTRPGEGISLKTAQKLQMLYRVDQPDNGANGNRFGDVVHYTDDTDSYYFRVYTDTAVGLGLTKPAAAEIWTFDDLLHHAEAYDASDSATWMFDILAAAEAAGASARRPSIIDTKGINVHSSYGVDVIGTHVHHMPGTGIQNVYGVYLNFQDNEVSHSSRLSYTGTHGMQFYYVGEDNAGVFPASDPYAADPATAFNIDADHDYKIMVIGNHVHHNYNGLFSWNVNKNFIEPKLDEGKGLSPQFGDPLNKDTGSNSWSQDNDRFLLANNVTYLNGLAGIHNHETSRVDIVGNTAYLNHLYMTVFRVPYVSNQVGITHQGGSDVSIQNNIAVISDLTVDGTPTGASPMNATNGTYPLEIRATANLLWALDGSVTVDSNLVDPEINKIAFDAEMLLQDPRFSDASNFKFAPSAQSPNLGQAVLLAKIESDTLGVLRASRADIGALQYVEFSYTKEDNDSDGLPDEWESLFGLDPNNPDSDGDGYSDGREDNDQDGYSNLHEYALLGNPVRSNTDLITRGIVDINGKSYPSITFLQRRFASDISYVGQVTYNLVEWNEGSDYLVEHSADDQGDGSYLITLRSLIPVSDSEFQAIRLKIIFSSL